MSAISKINHALSSLRNTHVAIAQYILKHPQEVTQISVQELANRTKTSPAAIVRFSKRVGYEGFPQLKLDLAVNVHTETIAQLDDRPSLDSTFESFLNAEQNSYTNTVLSTFNLINSQTLQEAIEYIRNARRVYLVGLGASSLICQDLMMKLTRIDIHAFHYFDSHVQLGNSIHLTHEDVILAVSYRGKTADINEIVKNARHKHIKVIAITQNNNSPLAKYADLILTVPSEENEFRLGAITSRNASLILTDLLYLGVVRDIKEKASKDLIESRKLILELNKPI